MKKVPKNKTVAKKTKIKFICVRCGRPNTGYTCNCDKLSNGDEYSSSAGYGGWGHDE